MIFGTGTDLIEVSRIKTAMERESQRFTTSIYTEKEIAYCQRAKRPGIQAQCFAGRFSAKEAFFKALGTGLRDGLSWKDVEILNDELGKPKIHLHNRAHAIIEEQKISNIHLSISHTKSNATAIVILEKREKLED